MAPEERWDPESLRVRDLEPWRRWGPYLAERQWGTVREDYSADGSAWTYFPHDQARSRAYRWGEDGLGGLCDDQQQLCLALAFWNQRDDILKERLFGLSGPQGNHGEDVKEYYYYLDATPSHSYLKMLYKYPQAAFPYAQLIAENGRRSRLDPEYELIDTGIFERDAYFDIFIEYAKAEPADILLRITAHNRASAGAPAPLHVLPQIWFRNTWSWGRGDTPPLLAAENATTLVIHHPRLGVLRLYGAARPELLFCDNQTDPQLWNLPRVPGQFYKNAFHDYLVGGCPTAVNPARRGTKAGVHYAATVAPGGMAVFQLRLTTGELAEPFAGFDALVDQRRHEADVFYQHLEECLPDADARRIQRQALAGMIWSKQYYHFDISQWLAGDPAMPPPPPARREGRASRWRHLNNADVLAMPDTWEFPWYAAWDLAFHCLPLALLDPEFAKEQLLLLTREWYMHPNGQLPAYEWAFSDVNPPVHAWAAWRVFQIDRKHHRHDAGDIAFLERIFQKLLLNFTWWVNRKDWEDRNVFEGGFLGLDNIGVFDRAAPLPGGGHIAQADATAWMAMYCLNMLRLALELSRHNPVYQDLATKFFEHFLYIAAAMNAIGGQTATGIDLWDPTDEFYYDVLAVEGVEGVEGRHIPLKVRSMVGLIPLFAVDTLEPELLERLPDFKQRLEWFLNYRPDLAALISRWWVPGQGQRRLLSLLRGHRMKCLLRRMLDPQEFLSPFGVRALSRIYLTEPYVLACHGTEHRVAYVPGESDSALFGGNSNWRGPVWFPVNFLIIESLQRFHHYYGDDFKVECPTGSGIFLTLRQVADELTGRLTALFRADAAGRRPVFGYNHKIQTDPHFRDYILFHEYFHGDNGWGLGASHQTGWTGLIAKLLHGRAAHCPGA